MYELICTCGYSEILKDVRDLSKTTRDPKSKELRCPCCDKILQIKVIS